MDPLELSQLLAQSLPFRDLPAEALQAALAAARQRQVRRDAFFFHQGDPATAFYLLVEGEIKLVKVAPEGHQVLVRFLRPGDGFGLIAVLGNAAHPLSAQAAEDCRALAWDGETVVQLIEQYPRLALNAIRMVAARFQELQNRYLELATERVERRVAHTLLRLARQAGHKVEEGVLLDLPLSRQDLADMTGTTLYTVSRILSHWEHDGLIETGRLRLLIRHPHGLVAIAEDLPAERPPA